MAEEPKKEGYVFAPWHAIAVVAVLYLAYILMTPSTQVTQSGNVQVTEKKGGFLSDLIDSIFGPPTTAQVTVAGGGVATSSAMPASSSANVVVTPAPPKPAALPAFNAMYPFKAADGSALPTPAGGQYGFLGSWMKKADGDALGMNYNDNHTMTPAGVEYIDVHTWQGPVDMNRPDMEFLYPIGTPGGDLKELSMNLDGNFSATQCSAAGGIPGKYNWGAHDSLCWFGIGKHTPQRPDGTAIGLTRDAPCPAGSTELVSNQLWGRDSSGNWDNRNIRLCKANK